MRPLSRFVSPMLIALVVLFVPFSVSRAQPGPGIIRTAPALYSIDVGRYGANTDPTFDNTLAIQAALDAVHALGGGEVTITKPGDYIVTDYLTSAGAVPTAPNTTLNSCLVIYSNTTIRMVTGARIVQGLVRDDSKCYLLRNADPTNGNTNISLIGGGYNGGGVVAEATLVPATNTLTLVGDYTAKITSGAICSLNTTSGKSSLVASGSTYSSGTGLTTVSFSSGTALSGGFQCSWQQGNTLNLAITARNVAAGTFTVTDNGADLVTSPNPNYTNLIGSKVYVTQNSGAAANTLSGYTVTGVVDNGATSTVTVSGTLEATTAADGNLAFNYNQLWYQDGIYFNNVTNLTMKDLALGGWNKYASWFVNVRGADFQNIVFNAGSDGMHIGGLCSNIHARNIRGTTLDNMFPLVSSEHWYRPSLYATTCGAITNVTLDGFICDPARTNVEPIRLTGKSFFNTIATVNAGAEGTGYFAITGDWTSVYRSADTVKVFGDIAANNGIRTISTSTPPALISGETRVYVVGTITANASPGQIATESRFAITDCTIKGGRGTTTSNAIRLGDDLAATYGNLSDTPMTGILIQDIDMVCQSGYAIVDISGSNVRSVTVRDVRLQSAVNKAVHVHTPTGQLANKNTWVDQLTIDGLTSMVGTTDKIVQIDAYVNNLNGSNWNLFVGASGIGMLVNQIAAVTGPPALYAEGQVYNGSLTNCVFDNRGTAGGTLINFANTTTTIPTKMALNNVVFKCSSGFASTAIGVNGVVKLQFNNVFFDMAASSSPILFGTSGNAWLQASGKGIRSNISKAYVYGVSTPTSNSNNASALNQIYVDTYLPIYQSGTVKLNVACQDFPMDITRTGFSSTVPGNEVTGDCFYNTAAQTSAALGSPGAGYMHFVADNGAVGGTSSSGYWEMVGTPKPITSAGSVTLSAYASKQTIEITATGTVTIPPAKVGMTFTILNNSSGTVTLTRSGSDTIQTSNVPNSYLTSVVNIVQGNSITLKCITATKWNIVASQGIWDADGS